MLCLISPPLTVYGVIAIKLFFLLLTQKKTNHCFYIQISAILLTRLAEEVDL